MLSSRKGWPRPLAGQNGRWGRGQRGQSLAEQGPGLYEKPEDNVGSRPSENAKGTQLNTPKRLLLPFALAILSQAPANACDFSSYAQLPSGECINLDPLATSTAPYPEQEITICLIDGRCPSMMWRSSAFFERFQRGKSETPAKAQGGSCDTAGDTAKDGSRCGGRAASEKAGGR
jgi:hypothetical protein